MLANKTSRTLPKVPDDPHTHETFHASVLEQEKLSPVVGKLLASQPTLVAPLADFERQIKETWSYDPHSPVAQNYGAKATMPELGSGSSDGSPSSSRRSSWVEGLKTMVRTVSLKGSSKRSAWAHVFVAVAVSETGESKTVDVEATATVPKRFSRTSRSKQA